MRNPSKVLVLGAQGMVGSAICRALERAEFREVLKPTRKELDLTNAEVTNSYFAVHKPEYVYMAAAKVGGILANDSFPAQFLYDNLMIEANVVNAAHQNRVFKLLFLGSTCIYPRLAPQPLKEEYLLTGPLEPTNEWYAIAKIAGIKLCQAYRKQYGANYIAAMPTNLYGPYDNFELQSSHVLPALIRKFHDAQRDGSEEVVIWGSGTPRREFLHVDDCADACLFLMERYNGAEPVNIGVGEDIEIEALARLIARAVGFKGRLAFDSTKPDGTPRKLVDVTKIRSLGWRESISLEEGIRLTYDWYKRTIA